MSLKKTIINLIILLAVLIPSIASAQWTFESQTWDNKHGYISTFGDPGDTTFYDTLAGFYDFAFLDVYFGTARHFLWRNPDMYVFAYAGGTNKRVVNGYGGATAQFDTMGVIATEKGWDFYGEIGYGVDHAFLHFSDDTEVAYASDGDGDGDPDTLFVPGWPDGSAANPAEARIPIYKGMQDATNRANRMMLNYSNFYGKQINKEGNIRYALYLKYNAFGGDPYDHYAEGIFLDNSTYPGANAGISGVVYGGTCYETGQNIMDADFETDWWADYIDFLGDLRDTLQTADTWHSDLEKKYIMLNSGPPSGIALYNDGDPEYSGYKELMEATPQATDMIMWETHGSTVWYNNGWFKVYAWADSLANANNVAIWEHARVDTANVGIVTGEKTVEKALLDDYGAYLTTRQKSTVWSIARSGIPPFSAGWTGSNYTLYQQNYMSDIYSAITALGDAEGTYMTEVATGTDPNGRTYYIYKRNYDNGFTLLRPLQYAYALESIEASSGVTYDLSVIYDQFNIDGTLSSVGPTITMLGGSSAILLNKEISSVDPTSIDLGNIELVGGVIQEIITITSLGTANLTGIASISGSGWAVDPTTDDYDLAYGESQEIIIQFTPSSEGTFPATISFSDGVTDDIICTITVENNADLAYGSYGSGPAGFRYPMGVCIDELYDLVYVADRQNNRFKILSVSDLTLVQNFSTGSGRDAGNMYYPSDLVTYGDDSDTLLIADAGANRIQKFDYVGTYYTTYGTFGGNNSKGGKFDNIVSMDLDSDGTLAAVDMGNYRIQIFGDYGATLISVWSGKNNWKDSYTLVNPVAVAFDPSEWNRLYVLDAGKGNSSPKIYKTDYCGNLINSYGSYGSENGEFKKPNDIDVDSNGNVYVADTFNHRIQKFDSEGNFISKYGTYGSGDGEMNRPMGLAISSSGRLIISDTYNHRVLSISM